MDFSDFGYVPILAVRPSEMTALEELPPSDKDYVLPYIILRPWLTARHMENVLARVEAARGRRPILVDLTSDIFGELRRPVHDVFDALRDSTGG